jgi:AcrR family transcriptional regulator
MEQKNLEGPRTGTQRISPRDRVLRTATDLFYRHGIHSVGIDRIISESGVAKMTFYRHFPSKARLVAEYLAQREEGWQQLITAAGDASKTPLERVLSLFDALEVAIKSRDFSGCPFIKALGEFGPERNEPEVRAQIAAHFAEMERSLASLLKQINPRESKKFLSPMMSLITGTIVVAQATGQTDVAGKNKEVARGLLRKANR